MLCFFKICASTKAMIVAAGNQHNKAGISIIEINIDI